MDTFQLFMLMVCISTEWIQTTSKYHFLLTMTLLEVLFQVQMPRLLGYLPHFFSVDGMLKCVVNVSSVVEEKLHAPQTASADSQDEWCLNK